MAPPRLSDLCRWPIVAAPMAGGPSTVELVAAVAEAGGLGFLAAGYQTPGSISAQIATLRQTAPGIAFGVNMFVPGTPAADPEAVARYVARLAADAEALGVVPGEPRFDDDSWDAKVELLLAEAPPVVSFTFGCPPAELVAAFQERGSAVAVTVTTPGEADVAVVAGADLLCVQGLEAGAHRGSFMNDTGAGRDWGLLALLEAITARTDTPVLAAGGIAGPGGVAAALAAGAVGVQVGTAFLRCPESGAHPIHKAALVDPAYPGTTVTRAFSGRPARGLVNRFVLAHADAPAAYPEIHHATRPLRTAAAAAGEPGAMSLWAGQNHLAARDVAAGEVVEHLRKPPAGGMVRR